MKSVVNRMNYLPSRSSVNSFVNAWPNIMRSVWAKHRFKLKLACKSVRYQIANFIHILLNTRLATFCQVLTSAYERSLGSNFRLAANTFSCRSVYQKSSWCACPEPSRILLTVYGINHRNRPRFRKCRFPLPQRSAEGFPEFVLFFLLLVTLIVLDETVTLATNVE